MPARPLRTVFDGIALLGSGGVAHFVHHGRIVEEVLLDELFAAPGLPGHLLHRADRAVPRRELEAPANRGMIAVEQQRANPGGLDARNPREHRAFLCRERVPARDRRVLVLPCAGAGRIEALDGADMIIGLDGGGEGSQRFHGRHLAHSCYRLMVGIYRLKVGKSIAKILRPATMDPWRPSRNGGKRRAVRSSRRRIACSAIAALRRRQSMRWQAPRASPRAPSTTTSRPRRRCSRPCSSRSRKSWSPRSIAWRGRKRTRWRRWPGAHGPISMRARTIGPARSFCTTGRRCSAGSAGARSTTAILADASRPPSSTPWI